MITSEEKAEAFKIINHHKKVVENLEKQLKSGKITKEIYDQRLAKQEENTVKQLKGAIDSDINIKELMKPGR